MGAPVPQMFEQMLDIVSGWVNGYSLEKVRPLKSTLLTSATATPAGTVVHIDGNGDYDVGASGHQMPLFLWAGSQDNDVYNNGVSPISGTRNWIGISPTGTMRALPAIGGYEFQTTQYVSGLTYAPNDLLKDNGAGKVTNATVTAGVHCICGVASWHENGDNQSTAATGPEGVNAHGITTLTFWGYFLPVIP